MSSGTAIVLTADQSLMSGYRLLFDGMLAASQTTTAPIPLIAPLLLPGNRGNAPLGLRRVEAALRLGGFGQGDVTIATEGQLSSAIGGRTKIVGISAGEPGGRGMNSSTMAAVAGGRIWPEALTARLMQRIARLRVSADPAVRVVLGGPGAWQVASDAALRKRLGVDHVITGYVEGNIADVFARMIRGEQLPEVIAGEWSPAVVIPPICGPTTMGAVEISRGCGLGCSFCTIARTPMAHLPVQTILHDVRTNLAGGERNLSLLSEDVFRYGGEGRTANPPALIELLEQIRKIPETRLIQVDHANLLSLAQFSDEQLTRARSLMGVPGQQYVWVNLGIESPDGHELVAMGARGKLYPCSAEQWNEFCRQQLDRLAAHGFLPLVSLLMCGESQSVEQVRHTTRWVRQFDGTPVTFFPMLVAPIDGEDAPLRQDMRRAHWDLMRECYRHNFRWLPRMYWDNQVAGGEGIAKRVLLQGMGRGQAMMWNALFRWRRWRARA